MAAMGRTCTKRLTLKKEDFELELEREDSGVCRALDAGVDFSDEAVIKNHAAIRASMALSKGGDMPIGMTAPSILAKEELPGTFVNSPMVGTYYSSPSPEDPSFVKVGDKIDKNTIVCIIEAMKVMNEVKAGVAGTVAEMLVESGHPVEFGTKLFRITT